MGMEGKGLTGMSGVVLISMTVTVLVQDKLSINLQLVLC